MKRIAVSMSVLIASVAGFTGLADAALTWGTAQTIPGLAALDIANQGQVNAVSCISAGNCVIGGSYSASLGTGDAFLAPITNGVVGSATVIPSVQALDVGGYAEVRSISCTAAGTCAALGDYKPAAGQYSVWVATLGGAGAVQVPGLAALDVGNQSSGAAIVCTSADTCTGIGNYTDGTPKSQVFVFSIVAGTIGTATKITGVADAGSFPNGLSCWGDGNCVAIGSYDTGSAFVPYYAMQTSGTWSPAADLPGLAALVGSGSSTVDGASCTTDGFCTIVGTYDDGTTKSIYHVDRVGGTWQNAAAIAGVTTLTGGDNVGVAGVSCWPGANCVIAAGHLSGLFGHAFVIESSSGTWGTPMDLPGGTALDPIGGTTAMRVSCATDGLCAIVGEYTDNGDYERVQVWGLLRTGGAWATAMNIPGTIPPNQGWYADPKGLSCVVGGCVVGGYLRPNGSTTQAWVAQLSGAPDPTPTPEPVRPVYTG